MASHGVWWSYTKVLENLTSCHCAHCLIKSAVLNLMLRVSWYALVDKSDVDDPIFNKSEAVFMQRHNTSVTAQLSIASMNSQTHKDTGSLYRDLSCDIEIWQVIG